MLGSTCEGVNGFVYMKKIVTGTVNSCGVAYYAKWKAINSSLKSIIVAWCIFLDSPVMLSALGLLLITKTLTCAYFTVLTRAVTQKSAAGDQRKYFINFDKEWGECWGQRYKNKNSTFTLICSVDSFKSIYYQIRSKRGMVYLN